MRRVVAVILLLSMAAGIGWVYVYPMLNPVHVEASRVDKGNLYVTVKAAGQVGPKELVPVLAPAPAKVVSIAVALGQEVKKGDLLMDVELVATGQGLTPPTAPSVPSAQPPAAAPPAAPSPAPATAPPTQAPQSQPSPSPAPSQPSPAPSQPSPAPGPSAAPPPAPGQSPAPSGSYTVQPGDTLSDIAQRNGTTVEEIARSNGLSNPDLIYPDQQLNIPQGSPGQGGAYYSPSPQNAMIVSSITSPIDGQVVKLEVRTDQLVAAQTPLAVVADMSALFLEILADQEDLPEIGKDKLAQVVLDALPKEAIKGKVEAINLMPVTSPLGTSGYPVKVGLESPPEGVRLGMTGQAEVITRQLSGVIFVPKRAVLERKGEALVFVIEADRVQKMIVTIGQKTRDYYEITSGLAPGQLVAVNNLDEMEDGRRITIDKIVGPK